MVLEPGVPGLTLWLAGTIGHVWLTARWVRRFSLAGPSRDERWFATMLASVGTLSVLLHLVASTVGLGLLAVLLPLAAGHGLLALVDHGRSAPLARSPLPPSSTPPWLGRLLESAAIIVVSATVLAWLAAGSGTLDVSGTDAAHYHVPVAINLALGVSPLDLPATQHLYPMATSTLAAWFLIPVGDALMVDLVPLLPFLLTAASLGWMFRLVTGESGLAWCSWLTLAVFSTPMFRQASLMSADLLFGAAFAALAAQLLAMVLGYRQRNGDILLVGLATGLLIGAKTTGLLAAVFLLGLAAVAFLMLRWRDLGGLEARRVLTWSVAGLLAIAGGGVWLVRNWWLFGSPVAPTGLTVLGLEIFRGPPLEPTTYLSVLGDLEADADYSLAGRASFYMDEWLGRGYLLLLLPLVLVPLDALGAWWRGRPGGLPRLLVTVAVIGTGMPMVWLLIGAPWTSLEWTRGMALRYALPWFLLLPLLAWIGMFPSGVRWYRRPMVAAVVGALAIVISLAMMTQGDPSRPFPPAVTAMTLLVAGGGWWLLSARARSRAWRYAVLAIVPIALVGSAAWLADRDRAARREVREWRAAAEPTPTQALYAAVLGAERTLGRTCTTRRFFALTRFDEPLGVQSVEYRNQVFYAAREVQATARAVEPMGLCDYVVSTRAMLETAKAADLMKVLNPFGRTAELADVGAFVVLGRR